jgi:hypothetical protein
MITHDIGEPVTRAAQHRKPEITLVINKINQETKEGRAKRDPTTASRREKDETKPNLFVLAVVVLGKKL